MKNQDFENNSSRALVVFIPLWRKINELLTGYSPLSDLEIRYHLSVLKSQLPPDNIWPFVESLCDFWNKKISFHINQSWSKLVNGEQAGDIHLIKTYVNQALDEISSFTKVPTNYLDAKNFGAHIDLLFSLASDPMAANEVRFVSKENYQRPGKITKFDGQVDPGRDLVNITPLPALLEDDFFGQGLRDIGFLWHVQLGRIAIDEWNFPVIELENHEIGVPVEDILGKFGGCPLGYINNNYDDGYDFKRNRCVCALRQICPGGKLLSAGTVHVLAHKLWLVKNGQMSALGSFPRIGGVK